MKIVHFLQSRDSPSPSPFPSKQILKSSTKELENISCLNSERSRRVHNLNWQLLNVVKELVIMKIDDSKPFLHLLLHSKEWSIMVVLLWLGAMSMLSTCIMVEFRNFERITELCCQERNCLKILLGRQLMHGNVLLIFVWQVCLFSWFESNFNCLYFLLGVNIKFCLAGICCCRRRGI